MDKITKNDASLPDELDFDDLPYQLTPEDEPERRVPRWIQLEDEE